MVKVGLVTRWEIPSPRAMPRTKAVFPAPRSPEKATTAPGARRAARAQPMASVSASFAEYRIMEKGFLSWGRRVPEMFFLF